MMEVSDVLQRSHGVRLHLQQTVLVERAQRFELNLKNHHQTLHTFKVIVTVIYVNLFLFDFDARIFGGGV